ncbi:hypothetical protein FACS1894169_00390 [Bacteroidia bacterium]|nr:hypothetical protein FACS1894169_00390 [Bacteroidia bacterium]
MRNDRENIIVAKSFEFALKIVQYCEQLDTDKKFITANQLLKSGTSIGANIREAQNAESKIDVIHKVKIAAKEADETEYWLLLCKHTPSYPDNDELLDLIKELIKIISKIISTSKYK